MKKLFIIMVVTSALSCSTVLYHKIENQKVGVACGVAYYIYPGATENDLMQTVKWVIRNCSDEDMRKRIRESHLNKSGDSQYAKIYGDPNTARTRNSDYSVCILSWWLDSKALFRAFRKVCINREF